jgi:hypothetical protein
MAGIFIPHPKMLLLVLGRYPIEELFFTQNFKFSFSSASQFGSCTQVAVPK